LENEISNAIPDSLLFIPENWDTNFNNLLDSWYVKHYTTQKEHPAYEQSSIGNDSTYIDRLSKLNTLIELPYNETVRSCIDFYIDRRRNTVEYLLGVENFYFPMIEQVLDEYDLPFELKYLAIVESALNPTALSRAGASGLWQFIMPTGKQYGLEINSLIDERRDPLKATHAACQYFRDMYKIYGNWTLVLAAYNCGPGNVNKAIRRANGSTDYWKIYPYLPRETRSYVPMFIAVNYVMNYYAYHQLYPVQTKALPSTDTIMVTQQIHFEQIAAILNMEIDELRALNPQYKRDIIPGHSKPSPLKLPVLQTYAFIQFQDTIAKHRADEIFTNRNSIGRLSNRSNERIIHKVKSGETLVTIGNKYGVAASSIRKWNGLRSNKVRTGQNISLYVDNGGYALSSTAKANSQEPEKQSNQTPVAKSKQLIPSSTVKPSLASTSTTAKSGQIAVSTGQKTVEVNSNTSSPDNSNSYSTYKIKDGETYYSVAKKYPGYDYHDLMQINNTSNAKLKPGQIIKVPKI
jgi:membrane-bound lytic murein transglycosylase D